MKSFDAASLYSDKERAALLIDGANIYAAGRSLDISIDFKSLLQLFQENMYVIHAYYFTALHEVDGRIQLKQLVDWLDYNGYIVISKMAKEITRADGSVRVKGNMDVEIVVTALKLANFIDHIILATGDGDFVPLVRELQQRGTRVSVLSTIGGNSPIAADEIRKAANHFIDLEELATTIELPRREEGNR